MEEVEEVKEVTPRVVVSNPRRWSYASRREGCKAQVSGTIDEEEVQRLVNGLMHGVQSGSEDILVYTFLILPYTLLCCIHLIKFRYLSW